MASYEHSQILKMIRILDNRPNDHHEFASWVRVEDHLKLLRVNAAEPEVFLYALAKRTYIHAVIASEFDTTSTDAETLTQSNASAFMARASCSRTGESEDTRIEFQESNSLHEVPKHRQNLIYARQFEGTDYPPYYELLQEFAHAAGIHWLKEKGSYCRIDENGDFDPIVSITKSKERGGVSLITCQREPLEQYLAATGMVLVRFFDFTMVAPGKFTSWHGGVRDRKTESQFLCYEQCVHPDGHAFTQGVQVIPISTPRELLFRSIWEPEWRRNGRQYAEFIACDWRNKKLSTISTSPDLTTNYFNAKRNSLPFEVSPAFFRAEVLSKYKADRDKYTINETSRTITCRGAWMLKSFDVNEAGQVNAYICDLRMIPYQEQLHWKSYNEKPKGTISKRAFENDFEGKWSTDVSGLQEILFTLRKWMEQKLACWVLRDEAQLLRINTPVSNSKNEWARAFLELSKTVVEGFQTKPIRALLRQRNISFDKRDKTLLLLERLLASYCPTSDSVTKLWGLREAQAIRSKVQSHLGGSTGEELARNALLDHGTYGAHFEYICTLIANELDEIGKVIIAK